MDEFKTEEEQIAAIKNWWKNNGSSIILAIVAALAIVFGYKAWQTNVENTKASASALYQQLVMASTSNQGMGDDKTLSFVANELKEKYSDSEYALYAALFLAKDYAQKAEYDSAVAELDFVLAATQDPRMVHVATGRKARVLSAMENNDEALALLVATDPAFEAAFLEISGDIKLRQGDQESAKQDYLDAFELIKETPQNLPLLGVKLSDLGVDTRNL